MMNRVVITGLGAITPLGNTVSEFWESVKRGENGIQPITRFDATKTGITLAAEVKDFEATDYMKRKDAKRMDLFSQYGVAAAIDALKDSGLVIGDNIAPEAIGTMVGSGIGGINVIEEEVIKMHEKGPRRMQPLFVPMCITNMVAGNISMQTGAKGICTSVVTACATGTNAIGDAFRHIKHGYAKAMIAGGAEGSINESCIGGFAALTALSRSQDKDRASIPFDAERGGFVMGEGAGILILEDLDHAKARGAKIYAELVGYGATADAFHMTAPSSDGSGAGQAMLQAVNEAGLSLDMIGYINAHGTGTPTNDAAETKAIRYAFGDLADNLSISSTKSMIGHLLGAAGAVEAIVSVKALEDSYIPPTINYEVADEACDLDVTPNQGKSRDIKAALSNSLGFGGHNAVLCFKKWEGA